MQQQQQAIHTTQEGVSDSASPVLNILTDSPKSQHKQENENQEALKESTARNQQHQVTVQPTDSINLDFYNKRSSINTPIRNKKRRRCCDDCNTWLCCDSCGSGGSVGSGGGGSWGGGSCGGGGCGGGSCGS